MTADHIPVLEKEVLAALIPSEIMGGRYIDGTLGAGGHTASLLNSGADEVLAFDLDIQAISIAQLRLSAFAERVHIIQGSYLKMRQAMAELGWQTVDGVLLDLGVSSMQLDTAERGFAFRTDGPLDMRFTETDNRPTAADLVNNLSQAELTDIFFRYGEERFSRQIARAIIANRPHDTTMQLADAVYHAVPAKNRRQQTIHPATRVFQALRIAVNDELRVVEQVLPIAVNALKSGGRFAVISFHSLEDRIVKRAFKDMSTEIVSPPGMQLEEKVAVVHQVTRKPIVASDAEIAHNPRSRSAKLRVVEKI